MAVTSHVNQRRWQPKCDLAEGCEQRHGVQSLVRLEGHDTMESAIAREKAKKGWKRAWKVALIENPQWHELYEELT